MEQVVSQSIKDFDDMGCNGESKSFIYREVVVLE